MKTNIDLVTDIMTYSDHGALIQIFVISALGEYAKAEIADPPDDNCFISQETWLGCAKEVKAKLDAFYNREIEPDDDKGDEDETD